jgi:hypothetical protein
MLHLMKSVEAPIVQYIPDPVGGIIKVHYLP